MNIVNRTGIPIAMVSIAALLGLTLMMLGGPTHVSAQGEPTPRAHITVELSSSIEDTVSWSDPDACSSDYHIYGTSGTHRQLLGSADSGSTEATVAITSSESVKLYCGAYDPESSENVLVASTAINGNYFAWGTYSSAPLTALSISSGTLSPTFDRGISRYATEVASDVEAITLTPSVLTGYQTDFVKNPGWGTLRVCGYDCSYSYGDGITTGIVLSDADTETPGFQVNLDRGENRLGFGVTRGPYDSTFSAKLYYLTVTVQNSPATGAPTITGMAQVGETLTADTPGIADSDGLSNVSYSYQWLSSRDTEIDGATSSTYSLQESDEGKVIRVRVTFTDDVGHEESLTSGATAEVAPNFPATGAPTITGTAEMGETLTADTSGIVDIDGLDNVSFSYQWIRSDGTADLNNTAAPFQWNPTDGTADLDIDGATSATYTITATDVDKAIKLRVDFTDDKGSIESLTSSATVVVPVEAAFTFNIEGTTVNCDSYNVHVVNVPYKECDDPISTDQGASGEIDVEIEIAKSVSSQSYKFDFHIYQTEDSLGHYMTREVNDLCLGPGLAASALIDVTPDDGTGPFTYTDDGTIFELCPAGTFQLYVPWYRYNYTDQEYEYAGTFRRYFFITSDDEVDASIEKVKWITALYPDPPASHGEVQIEGTKQSEVLNRELTTFSLSIGGLVPDSDAETTDYVVRLKVIGENGPYKEVPWCHVGNVGYSYLLKTVPEDGRWAMDAHVLGNCLRGSWPDTLQVELFDGSDLTNYSEPIVFHGSHIISYTGELLYPEYGTHEFIAGKDIALGALPNSAATGAPTISGTAQVGETLTADTSGIADEDGLDNATFSYQWLSSRDTAIPGATGSTYTLVSADLGKMIKVKVSFTDDEGNEESLTSSPTASVADSSNNPATGSPTISGTMQVGQTLTASTSGIADDDGLTNVSYTYQWIANDGISDSDIQDATLSTYTLVSDDVGKTIKVKVSFSDDAENEETLTSAATDSVVAAPASNTAATGVPTITGTAQLGQTLTADTSEISDADGLTNVNYSFQWLSSRDTEIDGATSSTYSLQESDEGKVIKVRVTFTDDVGHEESLTSEATVAVAAAPTPLTANSHDVPTDHDGLSVFTFELRFSEEFSLSYKTLRDHAFTVTNGTVTRVRRLERPGNIRWEISVRPDGNRDVTVLLPVTTDCATQGAICIADGRMLSRQVELTVSGPAAARPNNTATGAPTISGTAQVGQTLTASTSGISDSDGLTNATFSYQWLSSRDTEIAGATGAAHALVETDEGKAIKVRVSFTDDRGNQETLTSAATGAVAARPNSTARGAPTISGTAQVGQTLTASTSGISDSDGLTNAAFSYQWLSSRDTEIAGATGAAHALVETDEGKAIKVRVSFTDDRGNQETLTSAATGAVAARPNSTARGAPTISGTAQVGQTLTASTSGISDSDGLTNAAFSYQWLSSRDTEIAGATGAAHALVETDEGKAIKVRVSFTDDRGNQETLTSAATGAVAARPNSTARGAPTISGTAQVGQTLTASTSGISDSDGLTNAAFSYQWLSSRDTEIAGATGAAHALVETDEGKAIKVRVSFTDDRGNQETLTSAATGAVAARPNSTARGAPTISGTAQVGQTLTASTSGISDSDGLTNAAFSYQWLSDDAEINGATASSYTLVTADEGKAIKVMVSFTDDAGNDEELTSSAVTGAVATVVKPPLTATIHDVPSSHNGQDAFIFELRFSEPPKPDFSYRTVWDHAFTVTGGSVTYVRRLEPGKNVRWDITVTPDSSADVAIALNATTDCEADGAICTSDGERLPASISAIVSGPAPVGTVPVAAIASGTTPVAEGATVSFTISLDRAAPTALSVAVSVADAGGVLSGAAPRSVAFATSDNSKTITLPTRDNNAIKTASTVTVSLATGSGYTLGTATSASVSVTDNDTAVWTVSAQPTEIAEGGSSTITLAVANGKTFAANQTVSLAVTGTASGSDYSLSATELTLPAGASSVTATVTARDDTSVESDETVIVTAIHDGQPIGSATVTIEANDVAVWTVSAQPTEIAEGGSSTITLAVANGKTFTANQTVSLAVTGTASGSDYSLSATELTLPAGASSVTATVTARDDASVESDETVIVTAIHDGQPIGSATVTIEANDVAVWTVSAQPTEIAEGGSSTITLAVANGKTFTANQTVSLAVTGTASGSDYSLSATELTLPAGASSVTATVTARDDASVESDETVIVTAIHDGQPIGSATVTIEANDVPLSNDATLSTLSLSGIDIGTFSSGTTDYSVIVEYDVASTTVTADPNDDGASVAVADANGVTYGTSRQVSLSSGDNEITVTVTAEDGNAMKVYTVTVTRAEPDVAWGERLPDRDIVLDSDAIPTGLWADDTNAWVISDCNVGEVNVYALSDGSKQDELSFTLADWSGCATALWSNGATLWVADFFSGGVRAYRLSDGARQSDQDLDRDAMLAAGNTIPSGLWSNAEIMWVADHSAGKVFAYRLLDWARVSTREFDLTDDSGVPIRPFGLWSNGETLLASNWNGDRVLAYDLSDGQRQTSLDIDTSASGTRNSGIWSDGETLWIVDDLDKRIYAYAVQGLGSTR